MGEGQAVGTVGGVSIVVPTFKEAANIAPLVERVRAALASEGIDWELLFVDDDSQDGSETIVGELTRHAPVRMEVRRDPPRDLSLSVIHGMRMARYDRLVVMDADLSHPPERIGALLAALDGDATFAVGSRYVPGGAIDADWGALRRLNSRAATLLALPLVRCSDPMSGFFATDRRWLPDLEQLRPIGYKIGLELMVRGRLRVREVPIGFSDRDRGESKMNLRQQLNYLHHPAPPVPASLRERGAADQLRTRGSERFHDRRAVLPVAAGCGPRTPLARFLSFWPAVSWNWLVNRALTFDERPRQPHARQWTKFVASSVLGLAVNVGSYTLLTSFVDLFARYRLLALVIGVCLGGAVNFLIANRFVYRRGANDRRG